MKLPRLITRRRLKWTGLVLCVLVLGVYVASAWHEAGWRARKWQRHAPSMLLVRSPLRAAREAPADEPAVAGLSLNSLAIINDLGPGSTQVSPTVPAPPPITPGPIGPVGPRSVWYPFSWFFIALAGAAVAVWALIIRGQPKGRLRCPNPSDQLAQGEVAEHDARLRAHLAGHDEPCPMCEYNLRGLTGTVCPECGEALRLRVSLREPKMAAYLCGLIGLSLGAGFSGIVLAWGGINILFYNYGGGLFDWMLVVLMSQFVIEGLAIWAWLARRSWIRRRSRGQRWALAVAAWWCTVGFALLFFTMDML